ncbi:type II secretion protein [Vibrio navarrensis]|uniref:pullulanase-type alpha-1,6-glucosidase n=1 Tax=Vibrio navarrensis TaxID=29495 RepID=UPI00052BB144|nr:pullulanase-type alpha-1,6-glucosidase [Vibrio navarrensis]KGK21588.1 type II secretion protein [Vibrio navarrensis]
MNIQPFNLSMVAKAILPLLATSLVVGCNSSSSDSSTLQQPEPSKTARVYYKANSAVAAADASVYDKASLYVWNNDSCNSYAETDPNANDWGTGIAPKGVDDKLGAYWDLDVREDATQCINFIPRIDGNKVLGDFDAKLDLTQTGKNNAVFTQEGVKAVYPELIPTSDIPANTARVYMNTPDGDQSAFRLHVWNDDTCKNYGAANTDWPGIEPTGVSEVYGPYWDLPVTGTDSCLNIIPNNKSNGDYQTANLKFEFDKTTAIGKVAFVFKGTDKVYYTALAQKPVAQVELAGASAIFADDKVILVNAKDATSVTLYYSQSGELAFDSATKKVTGATKQVSSSKVASGDWASTKPHLKNDFIGFEMDFSGEGLALKDLLKGQLMVVASDATGVIKATEVQPASALDALYADSATKLSYGAIINQDSSTTFRLWAPTAQSVKLIPYSADKQAQSAIAMSFDASSGAWVAENTALKHGDFYRYEVTVYHPATDKVETYQVTDPYSLSLSMNSEYSQVVDLENAELKPSGWDALAAPHAQDNPASFVLYEAHIRDFSALDSSTIEANRGKYKAFTQSGSAPVEHLKNLAKSGVTHLHLLPTFDIATINEDPSKVADINAKFAKLCELDASVKDDKDFGSYCAGDETIAAVFDTLSKADSKDNAVVQRLNSHVRNVDSFNWGYDPYHYTVPEGSYSSDAEGMTRIKEFREMVMAVKQDVGMNVVMDVVYNHTNESGVSSKSVLDRIVPWYYQRLNEFSGAVEQSTCCSNTAPENKMFGKLIDDSIATWVKEYKIDAFRWDLMGHHPLAQMQQTLAAAQAVDPHVYFYGEGWNFGEVGNDRMFKQATQPNLGGTGIGSFSDRLRDAVRGGGPFDGEATLRSNQGFGNGIYVQVNDKNTQTAELKKTALHLADLTRLGMAGNLKDFPFTDSTGKAITGGELDYNGQPAGYAQDAWEIQNYVSKHDNQTLWDNNQYKIAYGVTSAERTRMQAVSLSTAMLGQGVPFIHMGSELLRSKSMQRDSYDSGDWYNRVDFTKQDNNWNVGLPREDKDGSNWGIISDVITGSSDRAMPTATDIGNMDKFFNELAALRASSGLLTLGKGSEIIKRVKFHNTGADQTPGLIVMSVDNSGELYDAKVDAARDGLVVVVNASPSALSSFAHFDATGYSLHAIQAAAGNDSLAKNQDQVASVVEGKLSVPAWSVAVFEKLRN